VQRLCSDTTGGYTPPRQRRVVLPFRWVEKETAKDPAGWEDQLIAIRVESPLESRETVTGLCLEIHDLVLSLARLGRKP
jgi:hypothetical protein